MLSRVSRQLHSKCRRLLPQMRQFLVPVRPLRPLRAFQGVGRTSQGPPKFYKSDKGELLSGNLGIRLEYASFLTMQEGLIYPSSSAIFATFFSNEQNT